MSGRESPCPPRAGQGEESGGGICTSQPCIKTSMSGIFKRWRRYLWELLGKYSHLLVTWEGNNIKGLGDLKPAGPGEGRWQRGFEPLGRAMKTSTRGRQNQRVEGDSVVPSGIGGEQKKDKRNPKWQSEMQQLLQGPRKKQLQTT